MEIEVDTSMATTTPSSSVRASATPPSAGILTFKEKPMPPWLSICPTERALTFVIGAVPVDEPPNPILDRRIGREGDRLAEVVDIGESFRHVTGLHRHQLADRRLAHRLLDQPHDLGDLDRRVVADVVDAPGSAARCRVGPITRPAPIPASRTR